VKFGVATFPTSYSIRPDDLARAVEERGFESLFFAEHSHIPTSRETPHPGGGELPRDYYSSWDPFVALSFAAAATSTLQVATGACLVTQRHPIHLAHETATLDVASRGRFLFGVAAGWNAEEMRDHGTDPNRRFAVMRERVLAVREIWAKDEAEYHGVYADFGPMWSWPKPVRPGGPPVLVGGNGPRILPRVVEFGDEWMPNVNRVGAALPARIAELNELASAAGRAPIPVTGYGVSADEQVVDSMRAMGVGRAVLYLPSVESDAALSRLDQYAKLIHSV
jgi:probable F420-dependent oxidoreductase